MKYDQQCTQCMPKRTFEALSKVIDYMWDDGNVIMLKTVDTMETWLILQRPHIFRN